MRTTYFYGIIEFGYFVPSDIDKQSTPLAIIQRVDKVKEFDDPEEARQFWIDGEFSSYVAVDSVNQNDVQYQLVFQKHA